MPSTAAQLIFWWELWENNLQWCIAVVSRRLQTLRHTDISKWWCALLWISESIGNNAPLAQNKQNFKIVDIRRHVIKNYLNFPLRFSTADNKCSTLAHEAPCTVKPLNCLQWTIVSCRESREETLWELIMSSTGHRWLLCAPGAGEAGVVVSSCQKGL